MHRLMESPTTEKVVDKNVDTLTINHPDPKEAIAHYLELPLVEKTIS